MLPLPNLKVAERNIFRSFHQDGLWDIYIGCVAASMAVLANPGSGEQFTAPRLIIYLVGMLASSVLLMAGKKFITLPRLGQVKFGPQRKRRLLTLAWVLGGIVALQAGIVLFSTLLWKDPSLAGKLGLSTANQSAEHLLVSVLSALFVGPSMALLAYFNDFTRGYYIAAVLSLVVFSLVFFNQPLPILIGAALILIPGVYQLIRFLREHPLPPPEARNG